MQFPYSLSLGDKIEAKLIATNVKGDSPVSEVGDGALVITTPDAPINLQEETIHRSPTTLGL